MLKNYNLQWNVFYQLSKLCYLNNLSDCIIRVLRFNKCVFYQSAYIFHSSVQSLVPRGLDKEGSTVVQLCSYFCYCCCAKYI